MGDRRPNRLAGDRTVLHQRSTTPRWNDGLVRQPTGLRLNRARPAPIAPALSTVSSSAPLPYSWPSLDECAKQIALGHNADHHAVLHDRYVADLVLEHPGRHNQHRLVGLRAHEISRHEVFD